MREYLPSYNKSLKWSIEGFGMFGKDKFIVIYPNLNSKIELSIIDLNGIILKSSELNLDYYNGDYAMKFKSLKNSFVLSFFEKCCHYFLVVLDSNLKVIHSKRVDIITSLDANETYIYCLTASFTSSQCNILIFDHHLVLKRNIGQSHDCHQSFYITDSIKKICHKNNICYCLYSDKVDLINEETGILLRSIEIKGDDFAFDSDENRILIISKVLSKIIYYSLDGDFQDEIQISNLLIGLEILIHNDSKYAFFNRTESSFYFSDKI